MCSARKTCKELWLPGLRQNWSLLWFQRNINPGEENEFTQSKHHTHSLATGTWLCRPPLAVWPKLLVLGKWWTHELAPKSSMSANHQLCMNQGNIWVTEVTWVGQPPLKMRAQIRALNSYLLCWVSPLRGSHTWHPIGHLSFSYLVSISDILAARFLLSLILPSAGKVSAFFFCFKKK